MKCKCGSPMTPIGGQTELASGDWFQCHNLDEPCYAILADVHQYDDEHAAIEWYRYEEREIIAYASGMYDLPKRDEVKP